MFFKQIPGHSRRAGLLPLAALTLFATASVAAPLRGSNSRPLLLVSDEPKPEAETIVFALMSGKCPTLKVAGRDFACRAVAFFQTEEGRANFTIALDDPDDDSHIITFSGDRGVRTQDNLYELPIDEIQLKSKDRPKVDGLPVPAEQTSTGLCRQTGNFAAKKVTDVTCSATDSEGRRYELLFVSDGTPVSVRRIRQSAPSIQDPFK